MKPYKKVVLSGMLSALSVLIMLIGSLFQSLDLSAAAAAGLTVVFAMVELGKRYAFSIYIVSSLLGLLLLPYKSPAVVFAFFAGFYPILKGDLQKIKSKLFSFLAKLLTFNFFFAVIIFVGKNLFGLTDDFYRFEADLFELVFIVLGNIAFIVYDYALDKLIIFYTIKIKKIFDKNFRN